MDLGLYNLKYPFRKMIADVLPLVRNVSPNTISWSLLPVGLATAIVYYQAAQGRAGLYLIGIALIFLRMFLGTLDGLVAVEFGKQSPKGDMVNRIAPELCDVMYLVALAMARPEWTQLGILVVVTAWLTTFAGMLGAVVGKPTQSVGPVGQTDRLAALQLFSLLAFFAARRQWDVDVIQWFLIWVVAGGAATIVLRLRRHFRAVAD